MVAYFTECLAFSLCVYVNENMLETLKISSVTGRLIFWGTRKEELLL
jgi:hypothetical protein